MPGNWHDDPNHWHDGWNHQFRVNLITTSACSLEPWESWLIREIIPKWPNYSAWWIMMIYPDTYIYIYTYVHSYALVLGSALVYLPKHKDLAPEMLRWRIRSLAAAVTGKLNGAIMCLFLSYTYIYICMYIYIFVLYCLLYIYTYIYMYCSLYCYIYILVNEAIHKYILGDCLLYIYIYIYVYIYIYICIYICTAIVSYFFQVFDITTSNVQNSQVSGSKVSPRGEQVLY